MPVVVEDDAGNTGAEAGAPFRGMAPARKIHVKTNHDSHSSVCHCSLLLTIPCHGGGGPMVWWNSLM